MDSSFEPKILVLATVACAYPGADAVGKAHLEYPANVSVFRVPSPVLFPEDFYLRSYACGVDGIIIAACGTDCPYRDAYPKLAARIDALVRKMKVGGLEISRMRITAICTVCIKAFLKEVNQMDELLRKIGPVNREAAGKLWTASRQELRAGLDRAAVNQPVLA
ncbi:MAG TPA: hydrogenase iron-sulfur subunit [Verrucomicrobiae bacterium]|nr:hydrogenase iron-sulfur subunit [Verrucomicrobiae bacterium]